MSEPLLPYQSRANLGKLGDSGRHHVLVRDRQGNEDRLTLLPEQLGSILHLLGRRVKVRLRMKASLGLDVQAH